MTMSAKTTRHGVSIRLSGAHADNFVKAVMAEQTNQKPIRKPSMKSFNQLARVAYTAYCKRAGGKNFEGKPLAEWTAIGVERQACWIEAVKAVVHEVQNIH